MINLTDALIEQENQNRQRKIGHYRVSDLWAMMNGYLKPEDYLKPQKLGAKSCLLVWQGKNKHQQLEPLLEAIGWETEVSKQMEFEDFLISGRADGLNEKQVLEIKTSAEVLGNSKRWHDYQVRIYCTLFEKPEGIICQPIIRNNKILLKELKTIKRNESWFKTQMELLKEYHNNLKKYVIQNK